MSVLVSQTDRIKGSSLGHVTFLETLENVFLGFLWTLFTTRNRLDSQSAYSFIPNN